MGEFKEGINTELNGPMNSGTFATCNGSDFTNEEIRKMSIVKAKAKLILAIKEPGQPDERKKARLVAQAVAREIGTDAY